MFVNVLDNDFTRGWNGVISQATHSGVSNSIQ